AVHRASASDWVTYDSKPGGLVTDGPRVLMFPEEISRSMNSTAGPFARSIASSPSNAAVNSLTRVWSWRVVAIASSPTSHGVAGHTSAADAMNEGSTCQ